MHASGSTAATFSETQHFRHGWPWALPLTCFGFGVLLTVIVCALVAEGELSAPPLVGIAALLLLGLVLVTLLATFRLETEVRPDALRIRLFPLMKRAIAYEDIRECYPRRYRPIREYGGWGIRWWFGKTAYNVSGNLGVQLRLRNGRSVLIGSQAPDKLATAIRNHLEPARP